MKMVVRLNGTNGNPYHKMGLTMNPFPQHGQAEHNEMDMRIQALAGDPIKDTNDLKKRLAGFTQEFIDICLREFVPGKMVEFTVTWLC